MCSDVPVVHLDFAKVRELPMSPNICGMTMINRQNRHRAGEKGSESAGFAGLLNRFRVLRIFARVYVYRENSPLKPAKPAKVKSWL